MRRFSKLLVTVALTATLIPPTGAATAATTVTYQLAGTASVATFPQASFAGVAVSESRTEFGVWTAGVAQDLGAITSGTFRLATKARRFDDTIVGGTFGGGFGSPAGTCAKTAIPVHGVLASGGSFDVTLTRYGFVRDGSCVVFLSTVRGTATLVA